MTLIGRCVTPLNQSFAQRSAIGAFRYHGERALLPGQVIDGFLQFAGNSLQTGLHDLCSQKCAGAGSNSMGKEIKVIRPGFLIDSGLHLYLPLIFYDVGGASDVLNEAGKIIAVLAEHIFIRL